MDFPGGFVGSFAEEGNIYFFKADCPVGIAEHMHVCIKHADKFILLSTCSSQIDTAINLAKFKGYDINTFPVFAKNDENKFDKPQTYINCNHIIELEEEEFGNLIQDGKIRQLDGHINESGLALIAKGVRLSPDVERRIKKLFPEN